MVEFGVTRIREHESHASRIEERHSAHLELQRQTEPVPVEGHRLRHVVLDQRDLLQLPQSSPVHRSSVLRLNQRPNRVGIRQMFSFATYYET